MDNCRLATLYAQRLESCVSNDDFAFICAEISIDIMDVPDFIGWREWLLTICDTTWHRLNDEVIDGNPEE